MTSSHKTIHIEPLAPSKPALGAPCNGCGVCCLVQPCPVGMVLSGRRSGACVALRWNERLGVYRCGAIEQPSQVLHALWPTKRGRWASMLAPALRFLARRSIALDVGCDCDLQVSVRKRGPTP